VYVLELGGEDDPFAAAEAATAATDVTRLAPGLATAETISDRLQRLAYTHSASVIVGQADASVASARETLESVDLERAGTVAVRARDVRSSAGVDTQDAERELGRVLVDRGYAVDLDDPDHELRALFAGDVCVLGWLAAESTRDFGDRQPTDRPFFQPGSMSPLLARALANLAGARPGATVLDPMCGTGGILLEAGLAGARVVGVDAQEKMVAGARENLAYFLDGGFDVLRGDASSLPIATDAVDGVVFDAPYGRQSKVEGEEPAGLVAEALQDAGRAADRAVLVADRSLADLARAAGWTIENEFVRHVHRSLDRHILVLTRD
jgi:tRNA (guanine10-N2)-dimethyltransferase